MSTRATAARFWWVGAVVVAVVGGSLGYASHRASAAPGLATLATTPFYECPAAGATALGSYRDGDRVALVGRDSTGDWVEARSSLDLHQLVWVHAGAATIDAGHDMSSLPERSCSSTDAAVAAPSTTTPASTSSSSSSESSSSSSGEPPTTVTTAPSTTSTTAPPDRTGPVLGDPGGQPTPIAEFYVDGDVTYSCSKPTTTTITVTASDPSGVASVSLDYTVGTAHATVAMTAANGAYNATIGPFPSGTITADSAINVTVTARDGAGNTSTVTGSPVTLIKCEFG